MAEHTEKNVKFEMSVAPEDTRFLVHNHLEIVHILRRLAIQREMLSAYFNSGSDLMLTAVLDVNSDRNVVILDYGSNETLNRRILTSRRIIFVTTLDSVKVQFVTTAIDSVMFQGSSAFKISIPTQVLRLQRREYFRLLTPMLNPAKCIIPATDSIKVEVSLFDISAGGVGIMIAYPEELPLKVGDLLEGCQIDLPGTGVLTSTLRVQNIFEATLKNGQQILRAGCQFINLRPATESLVQRYILKLERERIAKDPRR